MNTGVRTAKREIKRQQNVLTHVARDATLRDMPVPRDVFTSLQYNLRHDCERIEAIRLEMDKLASAYNRFIELRQEMEGRQARMLRIIGLIGPEGVEMAIHNDREGLIDEAIGNQFNAEQLRKELPLWQALQEYLRTVTKASVQEIQFFLERVGIKGVTRQAIESAVRAHPKEFQVVKKSGERFFSLRENAVS